ncbi:MAG: TRAP transporter substrate-binding protein [Rhodospirillales bacterium]
MPSFASIRAAALAAGMFLAVAQPGHAQDFTMKLAIVAINDPLHEYIKEFKNKIEAKTQGKIKAELYPAAQLGGIPRLLEGVQLGTIEMFVTPPGFFKGADPRFQVLDAPGLFDSFDHAHATVNDPKFRAPFLDLAVKKGAKGISMWVYGPTSYASTAPIRKLDDFKGKKFRVLASKVETTIMNKLGAAGVPMDYAEVLGALQQRTIDGIRSSIVVMGGSKFFTVAKNITVVNDTMIFCNAFVSTLFMDKLPANLKQAVMDVGVEMDPHMLKSAKEYDANAEKLWRDGGAEIIHLAPAEKAQFMKMAKGVGDEVLGADPQLKDMYNELLRLAEVHRGKS